MAIATDPEVERALQTAAARLRAAYDAPPIAPPRDIYDLLDHEAGYRVQGINRHFWTQAGRVVSGRKIGLTAAAVRKLLGAHEPAYGTLFADMQIADGGWLPRTSVHQPRVEGEIALVLGRDLDILSATRADVAGAVDHAVAAIEVVDSRIADWGASFADGIADNGAAAFYALGTERRVLRGLDLWSCGMVMEIDGEIVSYGAGAACLGHPLDAVAWLARKCALAGDPLCAGEVILTGALGPMVNLAQGNRVKVTVGGLGSVAFACEPLSDHAG